MGLKGKIVEQTVFRFSLNIVFTYQEFAKLVSEAKFIDRLAHTILSPSTLKCELEKSKFK